MKTIVRSLVLSLVAAAGAAQDTPKGGEFTAMATVTSSQGTRSLGFDVIVTNPMSLEQAQGFKRILADGGQQALANAIRGSARGKIRLGALEYPSDLAVAEKTKDGERYCVVTVRPMSFEETQEASPSIDYPFAIIIFDVPEFGKGTGHIFTKAAIYVDDEGHVRAEHYEHDPGTLKDVKRRK